MIKRVIIPVDDDSDEQDFYIELIPGQAPDNIRMLRKLFGYRQLCKPINNT